MAVELTDAEQGVIVRILIALEDKGMSRAELRRRLAALGHPLHHTTLRRVLTLQARPNFGDIVMIARALDVDLDELARSTGERLEGYWRREISAGVQVFEELEVARARATELETELQRNLKDVLGGMVDITPTADGESNGARREALLRREHAEADDPRRRRYLEQILNRTDELDQWREQARAGNWAAVLEHIDLTEENE